MSTLTAGALTQVRGYRPWLDTPLYGFLLERDEDYLARTELPGLQRQGASLASVPPPLGEAPK